MKPTNETGVTDSPEDIARGSLQQHGSATCETCQNWKSWKLEQHPKAGECSLFMCRSDSDWGGECTAHTLRSTRKSLNADISDRAGRKE